MLSSAIRVATRRSITSNLVRSTTSLHCNNNNIIQTCTKQTSFQYSTLYNPTKPLQMPVKTIEVPTMGDSITEGTIVDIPVAPGDYVNEEDVVLVLETDKVSIDVRASESGKVLEILGEVDDIVEVGSPLYKMDTDVEAPADGGGSSEAASTPTVETAATSEPAAAPVAAATPTPPPAEKKSAPTPPPPSPPKLPVMESVTTSLGNRPERRSKMSRMR